MNKTVLICQGIGNHVYKEFIASNVIVFKGTDGNLIENINAFRDKYLSTVDERVTCEGHSKH